MRLVFMGSPEFSVPALNALVEAGHEIACVYTQPPRPAGRGKNDRLTPVHVRAEELGFLVRTPASLKSEDAQADFSALDADAAVVVAYGLILPQAVLDAPKHGCLNIHASLLPRWRGAAPIHRSVLSGDQKTGVAIMQVEAGLDTGPVYLFAETEIAPEDTTADVHDRLSRMGARLIVDVLERINELVPVPQPQDGVTYARKIDKAEAAIDWTVSAEAVDRQIRGLSPFPGAWTLAGEARLKLLGSRVGSGQGVPGEVLSARADAITVACGTGAVCVTRLQRSGRGPQAASDFLRGFTLKPGDRLGG